MTDTNKLKELAERAVDDFGSFDPSEAEQEFMAQITPQDVLGLINEAEELRVRLKALIHISDATGWEIHTCGEIAKARAALEGGGI
ncbi:hypothetical protein [Pseudomonas citronellolis]|uniref:hypothetical protein n=1 Tax=Pseudomonas citronellolis TaxID=53408 RepID=UPI002FD9A98B